MNTISDFTIRCTEAQTRKALELGAPINRYPIGGCVICPTAEQMIGWLEEQGFDFLNSRYSTILENLHTKDVSIHNGTRKESTLAAIDAALEYLSNNKK